MEKMDKDNTSITAVCEPKPDIAALHRETLVGMLAMALDSTAKWLPWNMQIGALRFALDSVDDLRSLEKACFYCGQLDEYSDPERHYHEPEGWHWHHYLDPGDGLPSPCGNSGLLERLLSRETGSQWVRCDDRLPDTDDPVLVAIDTAYNADRRSRWVTIQAFCEGEWETKDVVAWMPLPEYTGGYANCPCGHPHKNHYSEWGHYTCEECSACCHPNCELLPTSQGV